MDKWLEKVAKTLKYYIYTAEIAILNLCMNGLNS